MIEISTQTATSAILTGVVFSLGVVATMFYVWYLEINHRLNNHRDLLNAHTKKLEALKPTPKKGKRETKNH